MSSRLLEGMPSGSKTIICGDNLIRDRENTEPLRGADFQTDRVPLVSSPSSDIRPTTLPRDDNDTTFVLTVPQRNMSILEVSDVVPDSSDDDESQLDRIEIDEPGSVTVLQDVGDDLSRDDTTHQGMEHISEKLGIVRKSKVKVSKHGIRYPSLPAHVVKKLAITFARIGGNSRAKISKDTLDAIMQASDWFFEQVSDDLGAYAKHGGRKTIDESDIVTLMSRFVFPMFEEDLDDPMLISVQTTPDKCCHNAIFSGPEISPSRASPGNENGSSIKSENRTTTCISRREGRSMIFDRKP